LEAAARWLSRRWRQHLRGKQHRLLHLRRWHLKLRRLLLSIRLQHPRQKRPMLLNRQRLLRTKLRHHTKRPILPRLAMRQWPVTKQALPMKVAATSRVQLSKTGSALTTAPARPITTRRLALR
jgi:hypothetical protein